MKTLIQAVAAATLLSASVFAFAQSNGPVTRADAKAELSKLEAVGYSPASDQRDYPANLQAAESKVAGQAASQKADGYGGGIAHSSQTGTRAALPGDRNSIYFGE
jgi:Domain of unknown function (DUF4148)